MGRWITLERACLLKMMGAHDAPPTNFERGKNRLALFRQQSDVSAMIQTRRNFLTVLTAAPAAHAIVRRHVEHAWWRAPSS